MAFRTAFAISRLEFYKGHFGYTVEKDVKQVEVDVGS
jgi:hypothetical protein